MNKSKLKSYAPQARKDFIAAVTARANLLGLSQAGETLEVAPGERKGDIAIIAGREWPVKLYEQRERLIKHIKTVGFTQTMEAVAGEPGMVGWSLDLSERTKGWLLR